MATLAMMLEARVRESPNAIAVETDETILTWDEVWRHARRFSSHLHSLGIGAGDRVALLCGNSAGYLVGWFAIANVGAVTVTVNTGLVGDGLRYALAQSQPKLVLIEASLHARMEQDIAPIAGSLSMLVFEGDRGLFALAGNYAPAPVHMGSGAEPMTIVYTSGTTGLPKGVVNCHTGYIESGRMMAEALDVTARDRIMIVLPLFHANPQIYAVMSAVQTGCTLIIRPKFSVSRFFDDARAFRATMFTYVGTILAMIVARVPEGDRNHTMTRCVGGGCTSDAWRKLQADFGIDPYELYGMSETAGWVSANSTRAYRQGTCGMVRDDIELAVVDDGDRPVPVGTPGEIVIRPRQPFRILLGYWDNPAATQEASRNFWFHTGDVGRLDADGFLSFLGRRKEIIRKGGENISPAELEGVILDFEPVEDAAVVAVPDPIFGDEIKACIVARRPFEAEELIRFLEPRVARFMLPRYLQFLDRIPRTETEKIQRNLLQQNAENVFDLSGNA